MKQMRTSLAILILFVWGIVLALGVGAYVIANNHQRIVGLVSEHAGFEQHGITFSTSALSPSFWPSLGVSFDNVDLQSKTGIRLYATSIEIGISWKRLLTGRLVPGRIELHEPNVVFVQPSTSAAKKTPLNEQNDWQEVLQAGLASLQHDDLRGISVMVHNGSFHIFSDTAEQNAQPLWQLDQINADLRLPSVLAGHITLTIDSMQANLLPTHALHGMQLENFHCTIEDLHFATQTIKQKEQHFFTGQLQADSHLTFPDTMSPLVFSIASSLAKPVLGQWPQLEGKLLLQGPLPLAGQTVPVDLSLPFTFAGSTAHFVKGHVQMEQDKATVDAKLTFKEETAFPDIEGSMQSVRLSLTRWFDFARNLPSSLQHFLNDITGELSFKANAKRLEVPALKAFSQGMQFTGTGGVASWSDPIISLNLTTPDADLNKLFPGVLGADPEPPLFTAPALVSAEDDSNDTSVGFNIALGANKAHLGKVDIQNLSVGIQPQESGVQLQVKASLYEGKANAVLGIADSLDITLDLQNIDLEKPMTLATGQQNVGGMLTARADLSTAIDSMDSVMANLKGSIEAQIHQGFLRFPTEENTTTLPKNETPYKNFPFSLLTLSFAGQGLPLKADAKLGPTHTYDGRWRLALTAPQIQGESIANGPLDFSTTTWIPVNTDSLPTQTDLTIFGSHITGNHDVTMHLPEGLVAIDHFVGTVLGGPATFSIKGNHLDTSPQWSGNGKLFLPELRPFLTRYGFNLSSLPPKALSSASVQGPFRWSEEKVEIGPLSGQVDNTNFTLSALRNKLLQDNQPQWTVNTRLGAINLSHYMAKGSSDAKKAKELDVDWLKDLNIKGLLAIDSFTVLGIPYEKITAPITVHQGVGSLAPIKAHLAGGSAEASARIEAMPKGGLVSLYYSSKNVDLHQLSTILDLSMILSGKAEGNFTAKGLVHTLDHIPAAFNGQWRWHAQNGYFVETKSQKNRDARRTFETFSGSGVLTAGILYNDNMRIDGNVLSAQGKGQINLNNETLDYQITASLPGIPDIPIHFYGSLSDPQSSVNVLQLVGGTLKSLGNVIGDILSLPGKILLP